MRRLAVFTYKLWSTPPKVKLYKAYVAGGSIGGMEDSDVLDTLRRAANRAGRQLASVRSEYRQGRIEGALPTDEAGNVRIVCRRHAEERAVALEDGRPECFDGDHPACESCAEDIAEGVIETW